MTAPNVKFTIGKGMTMLMDYFGRQPGQTSADFTKEVKAMNADDRTEVEQLVATEYINDDAKVKRFGIASV